MAEPYRNRHCPLCQAELEDLNDGRRRRRRRKDKSDDLCRHALAVYTMDSDGYKLWDQVQEYPFAELIDDFVDGMTLIQERDWGAMHRLPLLNAQLSPTARELFDAVHDGLSGYRRALSEAWVCWHERPLPPRQRSFLTHEFVRGACDRHPKTAILSEIFDGVLSLDKYDYDLDYGPHSQCWGSIHVVECPKSTAQMIREVFLELAELMKQVYVEWGEDQDDDLPGLDAVGHPPLPYPHVVVRFMPAVYGYRLVHFLAPDEKPPISTRPSLEVRFSGTVRQVDGTLAPEAIEAALEEVKRLVMTRKLQATLVLSAEEARYVHLDGSVATAAPPEGGLRMDHLL